MTTKYRAGDGAQADDSNPRISAASELQVAFVRASRPIAQFVGMMRADCYDAALEERIQDAPPRMKPDAIGLTLIGLCCLIFAVSGGLCVVDAPSRSFEILYSMGHCPAALERVGGLRLGALWLDHSWWRVLTTGFAHGSVVHLALNMWSLYVVWPWAAMAWGRWTTAGIFLVTSVGGVLASVAWAEAPIVVGASAGILGLAGALWIATRWGSAEVQKTLEELSPRALGLTLGVMIALGFFVPVIAQAGHLGGIAFGLLVGWGFPSRRAVVAVACLIGLGGLSFQAAAPHSRLGYWEALGYELLDRDQHAEAAESLRHALQLGDRSPSLLNAVAYALAEAGEELDWADELVDEALEADQENADYLDTKGWILCRQGRARAGLRWIKRASEASSGSQPEIEEHLDSCASAEL